MHFLIFPDIAVVLIVSPRNSDWKFMLFFFLLVFIFNIYYIVLDFLMSLFLLEMIIFQIVVEFFLVTFLSNLRESMYTAYSKVLNIYHVNHD